MNDFSPAVSVRDAEDRQPFAHAGGAPFVTRFRAFEDTTGLAAIIGNNVRQRRKRQGWSLDLLARRSGVSRAMLSQIELGRSTPTVAVLLKIAGALKSPISAFLRAAPEDSVRFLPATAAKCLFSTDGSFYLRALFPVDPARRVEFYEARLQGRGEETAQPQPPGTLENLVVSRGEVEIMINNVRHALTAGDAIEFAADVAHGYRNVGPTEAVMYLVMTYNHFGE